MDLGGLIESLETIDKLQSHNGWFYMQLWLVGYPYSPDELRNFLGT